MDDPAFVEAELRKGADRARESASSLLLKVREAIGLSPMR